MLIFFILIKTNNIKIKLAGPRELLKSDKLSGKNMFIGNKPPR